jgi:hypothetical protein
MRYMLLIFDSESDFARVPEPEMKKIMEDYGKYSTDLKNSGAYVTASRLRPVNTATSVRVRNGKPAFMDGPFAETKEQLGGFFLIDVKNLDEALQWASKIPSAQFGTVEVRPLWE